MLEYAKMANKENRSKEESNDWKPNLFVSGFPRSGSTALCDYLDQHPEIFVSKPKEPETLEIYYNFKSQGARLTFEEYKRMFSEYKDKKYRLDGSQTYSKKASFPKYLKKFNPDSKVVLVIRGQLKRIISLYWFSYPGHQINDLNEWAEKFLRPNLKDYLFHEKVKAFHKEFKDSLRVFDNSPMKSKPKKLFKDIFGFLGIRSIELEEVRSNPSVFTSNDSKGYRKTMSLLFKISDVIKKPFIKIVKKTGIYYKDKLAGRTIRSLRPNNLLKKIGAKITKRKNVSLSYEEMAEYIPKDIKDKLKEDYKKTLDYITKNKISLGSR